MVSPLLSELEVWVNGVDVFQKVVAVMCLLEDKGVIHIPLATTWVNEGLI